MKEKKVRSPSQRAKLNRSHGHGLEREITKMFRDELGYSKAKTSREASRMLDNSKVDVFGIPYLIQAKYGYIKSRPKSDVIFKEMEEKLLENFEKEDLIHNLPKLLFHKMDNKHKYNYLVTLTYEDFKQILLKLVEKEKEKDKTI